VIMAFEEGSALKAKQARKQRYAQRLLQPLPQVFVTAPVI
jgi:hypothetical protein